MRALTPLKRNMARGFPARFMMLPPSAGPLDDPRDEPLDERAIARRRYRREQPLELLVRGVRYRPGDLLGVVDAAIVVHTLADPAHLELRACEERRAKVADQAGALAGGSELEQSDDHQRAFPFSQI